MAYRGAGPVLVLLLGVVASSCAKAPPLPPSAPRTAASVHALIPLPTSIESRPGPGFAVTRDTPVTVVGGDAPAAWVAAQAAAWLGRSAGVRRLTVSKASADPESGVVLSLEPGPGGFGEEGYELTVTRARVIVRASRTAGLFYGVQTLRQLLPAFVEYESAIPSRREPFVLPAVRVLDRPRYAWRGAMLDVARHFLSVEEVERFIDLMALHKLNRLHIGLSNDQGWRIEIQSWPRLTSHGGSTEVGGGRGGFYTQADYARLVRYAAERFITVVPEIDVPGHTNAALASYAELNCSGAAPDLYTGTEVGFSVLCVDKDVTWTFLDDVVREVAALTPGDWFHIGGDEVKKLTPDGYAAFIARMQGVVAKHGKQAVGWDEIAAADLLPTTVVQLWRPELPKGQRLDHVRRLIMSPADKVYLDMKYDDRTILGLTWAGRIEVKDAYDWDPATHLPGLPPGAVIGVEAPLWTETVANIRDAEFLAFPRLAAAAEVAWSAQASRGWDGFRQRLADQAPRWGALGVNFYRSPQVPWRQ